MTRMTRPHRSILVTLLSCWAILPQLGMAQASDKSRVAEDLPSAPQPQAMQDPGLIAGPLEGRLLLSATLLPQTTPQASPVSSRSSLAEQTPGGALPLTRAEAEQLAIKNNPQISVGHLLALAQHQVYRESRAAELPTFNGAITAVDANEGSRIGAGALGASRLLEHAGAGVTASQLLTDFGRTNNLVASSKLMEKAQKANALATTED